MSTGQSPDPKDRDRGASGTVTETRETDPEKPDRPSMLQMTVSALTAVSATALLSFVGVWGTVFGMGLLSVLTVLGNFMYSSFIHRTAEKVKQVRPVTPPPRGKYPAATQARMHDDATRVDLEPITAEHMNLAGNVAPDSSQPGDEDDRQAGRLRTAWHSMVERYGLRRIVVSVVAVFVVLAGTVTVIEMAVGKPISGIVRDESGNGTSVFGGNTSDGSGADNSDDSSDPDGEPDQQDQQDQDPQDGDPQDEEPPTDEPQQDEPQDEQPPTDEPQDEEPPADKPEYEEPPADEPAPDDEPADEPQQEEPLQEEPPAEVPQEEEPPAE